MRECWGWWVKAHRTRGKGEVSDIKRIVEQVEQDYSTDSSRIYVCGLSSGAAMAVNCLVAYPDKFTGGASVAGLAYGESPAAVKTSAFAIPRYRPVSRLSYVMQRNLAGAAPPSLLIIHSDGDEVVSQYATDNLENSWKQVADLQSNANAWQMDGVSSGVPWSLNGYSKHNQQSLVRFATPGFAHGWLGGPEGKHSNPDAPRVSELIWWHLNESASNESASSEQSHIEPESDNLAQRVG